MASLEEEINRTWNLRDSGVPLYVRGGRLEVDEVELPAGQERVFSYDAQGNRTLLFMPGLQTETEAPDAMPAEPVFQYDASGRRMVMSPGADAAAIDYAAGLPSPPQQETLLDRLATTTIGQLATSIANDIADAVQLPHDVMMGDQPLNEIDPNTGETHTSRRVIERSFNAAGLIDTGGVVAGKAIRRRP